MFEKLKQFMREVKVEMKKTVYPSRDELMGSTWVVIVTVFIVSFYLGIIDLGLSKIVRVLLR
jgi:preprotein translocase subunit SecE